MTEPLALVFGFLCGALVVAIVVGVGAWWRGRLVQVQPLTIEDIRARSAAVGLGIPSIDSSEVQIKQLATLAKIREDLDEQISRLDAVEMRVGFSPQRGRDKPRA